MEDDLEDGDSLVLRRHQKPAEDEDVPCSYGERTDEEVYVSNKVGWLVEGGERKCLGCLTSWRVAQQLLLLLNSLLNSLLILLQLSLLVSPLILLLASLLISLLISLLLLLLLSMEYMLDEEEGDDQVPKWKAALTTCHPSTDRQFITANTQLNGQPIPQGLSSSDRTPTASTASRFARRPTPLPGQTTSPNSPNSPNGSWTIL